MLGQFIKFKIKLGLLHTIRNLYLKFEVDFKYTQSISQAVRCEYIILKLKELEWIFPFSK